MDDLSKEELVKNLAEYEEQLQQVPFCRRV